MLDSKAEQSGRGGDNGIQNSHRDDDPPIGPVDGLGVGTGFMVVGTGFNRHGGFATNPIEPSRGNPSAGIVAEDDVRKRHERIVRGRHLHRRITRSNRENFVVTSLLVPRKFRAAMDDIYAFCRTADDFADASPDRIAATANLNRLRDELAATAAGRPPTDSMAALHDTAITHRLDPKPFDDLIDAFLQDQSKCEYQTDAELLDYCRRSADPVGRILLRMVDADDDANLRRSDAICTGLQLTNFWQDIRRDLALPRLYVPAERYRAAGLDRTDFVSGPTPAVTRALVRELVDWADACFDRGEGLDRDVPRWLGRSVRMFVAGGRATLAAIRRIDYDVLQTRPTISKARKLSMIARQWFA